MSTSSRFSAALLFLCAGRGLGAQERPAIVQSVDLMLPAAPRVVPVLGKTYLVYELHITNFQTAEVSLSRLQVLQEVSGPPLAEYRGEELGRRLGRPGLRRGEEHPLVVGPGMRAIANLWIELSEGAAPPASLVHRLTLDLLRPSGPAHTTVEGGEARVSGEAPAVLSPPLRGGPWAVIYDPMLVGGHRTAVYTLGGRARIPGRFAVDLVRLTAEGTLQADAPSRPPDWNGRGEEVLAVADAVVVAAMDDIADSPDVPPVPPRPMPAENASGNYVTLDLGRGRFAFYEHLKHGSVAVKTGDRVKAGQVIGRLGHSGSSSMGPHLHFHVADANAPLGAEGVPFVFARFEHLGAFASIDALAAGARWVPDAKGTRLLEHPIAMAVIRF